MSQRCRHKCECAGRDSVALAVLCRVFDDGADAGMEEWRAWYNPKDWLWWGRGLGAFIWLRLHDRNALGVSPSVEQDQVKK